MTTKLKTIAERCDEMIDQYKKLDDHAHRMFDAYILDLRHREYPRLSFGSLKQIEISEKAGSSLNMPRALQILRDKPWSHT